MSRCIPFPSPGYKLSRDNYEALMEKMKVEKEREKKKAKEEMRKKKKKKENAGIDSSEDSFIKTQKQSNNSKKRKKSQEQDDSKIKRDIQQEQDKYYWELIETYQFQLHKYRDFDDDNQDWWFRHQQKKQMKKIHDHPVPDHKDNQIQISSSSSSCSGTSGDGDMIFSSRAAYVHLKANGGSKIKPQHWARALDAAIMAVSKYGGAKAGYRTLLDALIPSASVLKEGLAAGNDPVDTFVLSAEAALAGAESTKHMQAQAGRSTYISGEVLTTVPDPGAMAAASWYGAAAKAVKQKYQAS